LKYSTAERSSSSLIKASVVNPAFSQPSNQQARLPVTFLTAHPLQAGAPQHGKLTALLQTSSHTEHFSSVPVWRPSFHLTSFSRCSSTFFLSASSLTTSSDLAGLSHFQHFLPLVTSLMAQFLHALIPQHFILAPRLQTSLHRVHRTP